MNINNSFRAPSLVQNDGFQTTIDLKKIFNHFAGHLSDFFMPDEKTKVLSTLQTIKQKLETKEDYFEEKTFDVLVAAVQCLKVCSNVHFPQGSFLQSSLSFELAEKHKNQEQLLFMFFVNKLAVTLAKNPKLFNHPVSREFPTLKVAEDIIKSKSKSNFNVKTLALLAFAALGGAFVATRWNSVNAADSTSTPLNVPQNVTQTVNMTMGYSQFTGIPFAPSCSTVPGFCSIESEDVLKNHTFNILDLNTDPLSNYVEFDSNQELAQEPIALVSKEEQEQETVQIQPQAETVVELLKESIEPVIQIEQETDKTVEQNQNQPIIQLRKETAEISSQEPIQATASSEFSVKKTAKKTRSLWSKLPSFSTAAITGAIGVGTWLGSKVTKETEPFINQFWPMIGIGTGILAGMMSKVAEAYSYDACPNVKGYPSLYPQNTLLYELNQMKQDEIATLAILTPLALAIGNLSYKMLCKDRGEIEVRPSRGALMAPIGRQGQSLKNPKLLGRCAQLSNEVRAMPKIEVIAGLAAFTIAWAGNLGMKRIIPANLNLDPSGHVIMKMASTFTLMGILKYIKKSGQAHFALAAGVATAITDAVLIANTAGCRHTVADIATGTTLGLTLIYAVNSMAGCLKRKVATA